MFKNLSNLDNSALFQEKSFPGELELKRIELLFGN